MQLKLRELDLDCNIVVSDAKAKFLKPIREDLVCKAKLNHSHIRLLKEIKKTGSVVVELDTEFLARGITAMTSRSIYHVKNLGIETQ